VSPKKNFEKGGRAYLDIEDPDAPFDAGVKYTTMPPAKRFRDMHLLSGGEKTLAALALVFAVHFYQKPPFMVLDEVDAPLDSYNVRSIRRYLQKASFQAVVISLKDDFFSRADCLFGVYKDQADDQSGILSIQLKDEESTGILGGTSTTQEANPQEAGYPERAAAFSGVSAAALATGATALGGLLDDDDEL